MDTKHLQDRLYWALNRAANVLGREADAYRPKGRFDPLNRSNRFIKLRAAFSRSDGSFSRGIGYGVGIWQGYFDASYTRVGDYLVLDEDIWFIAEQEPLLPVLCVRANRIISVTRQSTPTTGASTDAALANSVINVISRWPASQLGTGTEGKSPTRLPGDTAIPNWTTLVPSVHDQILQPTDIVTDDLGTNGMIVAAELGHHGWRLNIRQVTT